jgi:predicted kinase
MATYWKKGQRDHYEWFLSFVQVARTAIRCELAAERVLRRLAIKRVSITAGGPLQPLSVAS